MIDDSMSKAEEHSLNQMDQSNDDELELQSFEKTQNYIYEVEDGELNQDED